MFSALTPARRSVCEALDHLNTLVEPDTGVGECLDPAHHFGEVVYGLVGVFV